MQNSTDISQLKFKTKSAHYHLRNVDTIKDFYLFIHVAATILTNTQNRSHYITALLLKMMSFKLYKALFVFMTVFLYAFYVY